MTSVSMANLQMDLSEVLTRMREDVQTSCVHEECATYQMLDGARDRVVDVTICSRCEQEFL